MNPQRAAVVIMVMNAQRRQAEGSRLLLRIIGAGLLIATAAIHLDLYLTGYRTIPTIGWLFLLQIIAAFALGLLVLVTRSRLVAAAGALFALSTLGGYLLTVQFGLFGFREVRTTAGVVAGIIEVLAFAVLAYLAATPNPAAEVAGGQAATRGGAAAPGGVHSAALAGPDWLTAGVGRVPAVLGAAVISVVALALLGGALAGAGGTSGTGSSSTASSASSSGAGLRTTTVAGATVLTNAAGRTLYSFAPDSATKSVCNGSCAAYWPPVSGPLKAGAGVTGKLTTITRADGSTQEVYNGHPLYTYIGDTGPGQANGNNLNLNGGLWKVVPVSG
jgi:predicted lipoprotein with Yx(FWY)xxD motif